MGKKLSCEVESLPNVLINSRRISSTAIRLALQEGLLNEAENLLGVSYKIYARVVYGAGRARQWGVPTANLHLSHRMLPVNGVFCVRLARHASAKLLHGVANIGMRPTVDGTRLVLEVHIFNFNESLYGEMLEIYFLHKLRDEFKFSGVAELVAQIHQDIAVAKAWFKLTVENII